MLKKISVLIFFVLFFASTGSTEEHQTNPFMFYDNAPTTYRQLEQIEWAYNQGYEWGLQAKYQWYRPMDIYPNKEILPIVKTAWEMGFIRAFLDIQNREKSYEE